MTTGNTATATTANATTAAPNLVFSHFGITVRDMSLMERFYTEVLGFVQSDRGEVAGLELLFLTRDPSEHHQIVLSTGRPESIPDNTCNPFVGPCIHHISFRMGSLDDLRDIYVRLEKRKGGQACRPSLFSEIAFVEWFTPRRDLPRESRERTYRGDSSCERP